jgi:hypothetical protein
VNIPEAHCSVEFHPDWPLHEERGADQGSVSITYRVVATDPYGNRGVSATLGYTSGPCAGAPTFHCVAKLNSCGFLPAISFTGTPSISATSGFTIEASGALPGKSGLLLYSPNGAWNAPFQGGTLCVAPSGIVRGPPLLSLGGTPGNQCDARFEIDMNAFASGLAGGNPAAWLSTPGQHVDVQWWGRDTLSAGSFLSDALRYDACP